MLETARGGILRSGLGFDACDVGVVLNVSADHLGLRGIHTVEQLAEVKALIAAVGEARRPRRAERRRPAGLAMRERTPGDVVLFSPLGEGDIPPWRSTWPRGGTAVVVEDEGGRETIVIRRRRGERIAVVPADEVPLTLGGAARFQGQTCWRRLRPRTCRGWGRRDPRRAATFLPSGGHHARGG